MCSVTQSCLTLCDCMNWSLPDSFVHGISQAKILEMVAISSSRESSQPRDQTWASYIGRWILYHIESLLLLSHVSRVWLCATPETAALQAPPSLGFSRQEHWSGLPFPSPVHESEKWKWSRSVVSDPQRPHGLQHSRLLRPWDFPGKSTGVGCQLGTNNWHFEQALFLTLFLLIICCQDIG